MKKTAWNDTKEKEPVMRREVRFKGLDCIINDEGDLVINVPVIEFPRFEGPMFDVGFMDFCRQNKVADGVLDQTEDAFYDALQERSLVDYLIEHKI